MKSDVLVDTSAWIDFFNKPDSKNGELVEKLLISNRCVSCEIILIELLQGAKIEKEFNAIFNNIIILSFLASILDT